VTTARVSALLARQSGPRINTLLTTAGTVGSLISTFAMRLVIARLYGPQPLGLYSAAVGYQRVTSQLADVGLHYALLRRGSGDPTLARQGIALKMLLGVLVAVVSIAVAVLVTSGDITTALVVGSIGVFGWSQLDAAQLWYRLSGRFRIDFLLHVGTSVTRVAIATGLLLATGNLAVALAAYFVLPAFASVFIPRPWVRPAIRASLLRDTGWSFVYRTLWLLLLNLDVFLVPAAIGLTALGRYDAPRSVAYALLALADGAFIAILQRVGAGHDDALAAAGSILRFTLVGMLLAPLAGIVAFLALPVVFGPAFAGTELAIVFAMLVVAYLAASGASTYASALLFERPRWMAIVLGLEIIVACVAYLAAALVSLVAVAATVATLHLLNLLILRQAVKRTA
jgi:O-antigen/teichoic acid export membrane protein